MTILTLSQDYDVTRPTFAFRRTGRKINGLKAITNPGTKNKKFIFLL